MPTRSGSVEHAPQTLAAVANAVTELLHSHARANCVAAIRTCTWSSLALLFYERVRPVNRTIAALGVLVILVSCAFQALTASLYLVPLLVVKVGSAISGFSVHQLQTLAAELLRLNAAALNIDLVYFGLWCILSGYLIVRCTFMPCLLGVLLMIDGVGRMTYLVPPVAAAASKDVVMVSG